jgi:AAA domain, putative AbiEii toxin, Type IV TA system
MVALPLGRPAREYAFVIERVSLHHFKAFERFTLDLHGDAYLAGPNNAGKSTLVAAVRVAAGLLRIATRRNPVDIFTDQGQQVLGYFLPERPMGLDEANVRHEFRDVETRVSIRFRGGGTVVAVWPTARSRDPFFYLQQGHAPINNVRQARDAFPNVGIVPVLSPIEDQEELLTPKYVRENLDGRLASRHFRNQLLLLAGEPEDEDLEAFLAFATPWLPEIKIQSLDRHRGERNLILDLYYVEPGRRTVKELVWAGDGIQIWLQLLLHVFRLRDEDVVVLDEPDVFLHPDLQRRVVRLLDSLPAQTITATHSSEVLVEAPPESVVWIDKTRRRSVSGPRPSALEGISNALGSGFSIRLARALRAKCALFVEGDDLRILRHVASTTGAARVATETGIVVIPLRGFDNWGHVEPFSWISDALLESSVVIFVLLDRDYRTDPQCREIQRRLRAANVKCHVWKRKELESYLLEGEPIARLSRADVDFVEEALADAADETEEYVFSQVMVEALRRFPRDQQAQAAADAKLTFEALWRDRTTRKWVAPPAKVIHGLNRRLAASGYETVSFVAIASRMHATEVPSEMASFLDRVEEALEDAGVPAAVR